MPLQCHPLSRRTEFSHISVLTSSKRERQSEQNQSSSEHPLVRVNEVQMVAQRALHSFIYKKNLSMLRVIQELKNNRLVPGQKIINESWILSIKKINKITSKNLFQGCDPDNLSDYIHVCFKNLKESFRQLHKARSNSLTG